MENILPIPTVMFHIGDHKRMESEFVKKKEKPTASDYLSASVEEVVERANNSTNQSEISFVTALFAAKSHQDQKITSNRMFHVALITTFIAVISLGQSFFSSMQNSKKTEELTIIREKLANHEKQIIQQIEKIATIESTVDALKLEREEYLNLVKNLLSTIHPHESNKGNSTKHNNANAADAKSRVAD
jgi:hypothetical protein